MSPYTTMLWKTSHIGHYESLQKVYNTKASLSIQDEATINSNKHIWDGLQIVSNYFNVFTVQNNSQISVSVLSHIQPRAVLWIPYYMQYWWPWQLLEVITLEKWHQWDLRTPNVGPPSASSDSLLTGHTKNKSKQPNNLWIVKFYAR